MARLISIEDTNKLEKLVKNLGREEKTVAIHIILTKIFNPEYNIMGIGNEEKVKGNIFDYNGLVWVRNGSRHHIKKGNLFRIQIFWSERVPSKKKK